MPSITQDLARTRTAQWLREARGGHRSAWNDRLRCFEALGGILSSYRASRLGERWRQPPISPPHLLPDVARGAHFGSAESVYQRWRAEQRDDAIKRWAGPDPGIKPREAFVAEAKIVSFWPYRAGALAVADRFDMSLTEVAECYLRALGAWASGTPVLAACVPAGPPPCVPEDLGLLAGRAFAHHPARRSHADAAAARLESLAGVLVAAVLDDASMTLLGAFNMVRDETLGLLSEPSAPIAVTAGNAMSELADRLLHRADAGQILTADQARKLKAEMRGLFALLGGDGELGELGGRQGEEANG
ncbi:MAG TPA: hypothetical protein VFQ44_12170 [Streptosporangiaceae bacterium]|nr:hypothetical protein [Streptosporangiaceae bacterium]